MILKDNLETKRLLWEDLLQVMKRLNLNISEKQRITSNNDPYLKVMYSLLIDTSHQKNAIGIFGTNDQWLIYNTFKRPLMKDSAMNSKIY